MIKITESAAGRVTVESPFHPSFSPKAKTFGGRWDSAAKRWSFDARDLARVKVLCVALYGTDGSPIDAADLLTIRTDGVLDDSPSSTEVRIAGRQIARIRGRDSGATLGDGVVLLAGRFRSGGSAKNPRIQWDPDTRFELRDVPRAMAEKVHATYHGVTLLDASGTVVAEPTVESPPAEVLSVSVVAEMAGIEIDHSGDLAQLEIEIASAEGRAAGLRFRAAELQS